MALLKEFDQENGDENVREVMENFIQAVGAVPKPLQLIGISPGLFMKQAGIIGYYRNHPNLEGPLLASIRFLAAVVLGYQPCIEFNRHLLKMQGMTEDELDGMMADSDKAPLEDKELALLSFVIEGVKGKKEATSRDIETLTGHGWTESDIIDAVNQGFGMFSHSRMVEYFKA